MELINVLEGLNYKKLSGSLDLTIEGVEQDSREVKENYIFIAIKGSKFNGHDYIGKAILRGAKVIVVTEEASFEEGVTYIKVDDDKEALAKISSNYYGRPSEKLELIGVTGTNGKTSITYMLKNIFEKNNKKIGLIGTMGSIIDSEKIDNKNTTPESIDIQRQLSKMSEARTDYCLMEVSSHAIDMKRVASLDFNIGIFTNLTEDHLDYHISMNNYFESKKKFFYMTRDLNIVNIDDPYGVKLAEEIKSLNTKLLTYGIEEDADVSAENISISNKGVDFSLNTYLGSIEISMNLLGKFNIYNALASVACALNYGFSLEEIKLGLETIEGIDGRFELLPIEEDFSVIIDFAHTPDGLEQVLRTVKEFSKGRIIVVFGAGGNRDKMKRPIMGEIVGRYSDIPIISSDNPRQEDPDSIIKDIELGTKKVNNSYVKIRDREAAIKYALKIAEKDDTIILAGKGHENDLIIGDKIIPFNEKEIVKLGLEEIRREN